MDLAFGLVMVNSWSWNFKRLLPSSFTCMNVDSRPSIPLHVLVHHFQLIIQIESWFLYSNLQKVPILSLFPLFQKYSLFLCNHLSLPIWKPFSLWGMNEKVFQRILCTTIFAWIAVIYKLVNTKEFPWNYVTYQRPEPLGFNSWGDIVVFRCLQEPMKLLGASINLWWNTDQWDSKRIPPHHSFTSYPYDIGHRRLFAYCLRLFDTDHEMTQEIITCLKQKSADSGRSSTDFPQKGVVLSTHLLPNKWCS